LIILAKLFNNTIQKETHMKVSKRENVFFSLDISNISKYETIYVVPRKIYLYLESQLSSNSYQP